MAKLLWSPSQERIRASNMYHFMQWINARLSLNFTRYDELYQWSVDHIADFWEAWWHYAGIKASAPYTRVLDDPTIMPGAKWFEGARLNFAENLLRFRDDRTALVFYGEDRVRRNLSYAELYAAAANAAEALKTLGVKAGDRVVGFMPNLPETVVAMLAATSIGAVWSSCSPDFGIKGVLDRFGQIKPKVLFTADGYFFKGKRIDSMERIAQITRQIPSIEKIVVVPYTTAQPDLQALANGVLYADFVSGRTANLPSCLLIIPCISCTLRAPPACPNAWCKAPAASWFISSRNRFCTPTSSARTPSFISPPAAG
jgi:acetoacetyl-CoA synthetase